MPDIVLIFEVHQPYRLNMAFRHKLNEVISKGKDFAPDDLERMYFDEELNKIIFQRVASRCYEPATTLFLKLLDEYSEFRVSFSFSGVLLEQAERWARDTLDLFKHIANHNRCEILGQTYYHSLAFMLGDDEFIDQVEEHRKTVRDLLGVWPKVFENTELIYDNHLAKLAAKLEFNAVVTEGSEKLLGWRSPNYVYRAKGVDIKVLFRNYRLSDDVGFRFTSRDWNQYPLTAAKYSSWLASTSGQVICVFMDYETIGEHFPLETGIFEFFEWLPREVIKWGLSFATPSEVISRYEPVDYIDVVDPVSWADLERDISAWVGNPMQVLALAREGALELPAKVSGSPTFLRLWRLLTISDHYYYMSM
ncbi:MAG: glycoside hydrolase family 57 protein, partial [Thermofilaceae archaeon]